MAGTSPVAGEDLVARLERVGRSLGEREAEHRAGRDSARACIEKLRGRVEEALDRFHRAAADAGAPHLRVGLSEIRVDDKHLRSIEFDVTRGRHRAIVTAKSRGDVTLVGPFRQGKNEGPCLTFPFEAEPEIAEALGEFLERFLEQAATP